MSDIRRVLRIAGLRLMAAALLRNLVLGLTAAILAVMVLRIVSVMLGFGVDWWSMAAWAPAVVFGAAFLWTLLTMPRSQAIARRVDEGANLKETISTALAVQGSPDPWCQTVVETASQRARGVDVRRAVPIHAPRSWPMPLTAALACLVVWLLPLPADVLGKLKARQDEQARNEEVAAAKVDAAQAMAKVEDAIKKLDPGADLGANEPEANPPEATSPEDIRRAAIKKLEGLQDKLEAMRADSDKAQTADALKDMLKQLRTQPGPMEDVTKAMAKGDFAAAKEALEELQQKIASGDMSADDKAQMARQLENLKSQMDKLAASQKDLEDQLKKAGVDPALASNPEALKKALEQNKNLSDEQKEQLAKAAQAKQSACQACQGMSAAMDKMAQAMNKDGEMGEAGQQGMEQLASQMSAMEMMMADAQTMDAALSEAKHQLKSMCESMGQCDNPGMGQCEGGLMNKPWAAGDTNRPGGQGSRGGPGQGQGGGNSEEVADETWEKRKVASKTGQGPIIGSTMVQGEQIKGESTAKFAAVADAAEAQASEALENNVIPREYHDVVKHYFGRLKAKSQAEQAKKADAPADQPAKDDKK